jgi:predicted DNA-binding protein with PD1-like motif
MKYGEQGGLIYVRLHQGEDLFESLKAVCRANKVKTAIVLSGLGMLKQAELNFFVKTGQYSPVLYPEPMELVSLSGSVIRDEDDFLIHLHAVLGRANKEAVAGHLSSGKVNVTNEIVMLKTEIPARREMEEATGIMGLTFE